MAENTNISWCDATANFWHGCMKVSTECRSCYAETLSNRWGNKGLWGPPATTARERKKAVWGDILKWDKQAEKEGKRRRVFVLSMGDFLEDHPMVHEWRAEAVEIIERLKWLDILMLTKRPENWALFLPEWVESWPPHVWFGVSAGTQPAALQRVPFLFRHPARVRFLSVEPMLEKINLGASVAYIDWVICGGESGPRFRNMQVEWARALHDQCRAAGVPFFMKQDSGLNPGMQGRTPDDLWNCKEFPL